MRGNRARDRDHEDAVGPTPARAGQPSTRCTARSSPRAYPRACGATSASVLRLTHVLGLPPRVRGNLHLPIRYLTRERPTPARAGQPPPPRRGRPSAGAYPRACGATHLLVWDTDNDTGLPPRVRGNRMGRMRSRLVLRPTPARAGQPPFQGCYRGRRAAYPRACGATRSRDAAPLVDYGLPPRVRGNPRTACIPATRGRPTPARAGQPRLDG